MARHAFLSCPASRHVPKLMLSVLEALIQQFPRAEEWLPVVMPLCLIAYFVPFFVAAGRKHRFGVAIGLVNLFLGWTVLGWFGAMIWAVNRDIRDPRDEPASPDPLYFMNEPQLSERPLHGESQPVEYRGARQCPFCAELIKAEAIVCRHCGRDVGASATPAQRDNPVTAEMMENHFQELHSLLKDHDDATAEKLADSVVEPATNYEPEPETIPAVKQQPVSADVVRELSGWKKFG